MLTFCMQFLTRNYLFTMTEPDYETMNCETLLIRCCPAKGKQSVRWRTGKAQNCCVTIDVIKATTSISWFESISVNVCRIIVVMTTGMAVDKNILPSIAFHHCSDSILS